MFCPKCGADIPDDAGFCPYCGCRIITPDFVNNDVGDQSAITQSRSTSVINHNEISLDNLKPVVETNTDYYMKQFDRIQKSGKAEFNWSAFQYSIFLCSYRKCYELLIYPVLSLMPLIIGCILIILGSVLTSGFFTTVGMISFLIGLICWLIASIWFGMIFNKKYYQHCVKMLSLADTGNYGTSIRSAAISFVIFLILIGLIVFTTQFLQIATDANYKHSAVYDSEPVEQTYSEIADKDHNLSSQETYHENPSNTSENIFSNSDSYEDNLESTSNRYSPSDFLGGWGSSGGRDELAIEMEGSTFKVTWSGSYGYNSWGVTEMTCTFQNGRLEFNDGTHTTYLLGDYNDEEASIVEYTNNNGFFYLCSPEEVDSYYDKFRKYTISSLAQAWDGYGDSAVPLDNGPYLLLIREPIETYASSEYVIWYSSQIRLSENDISFLSDADKRIALNEIYARHGRKFNDMELQQHFNNCSWYSGTVEPANFDEKMLSMIERYNIDLLSSSYDRNTVKTNKPVGTYVSEDGVYMVTGDRDGPLTGYVEITNNIYGTYDVLVADSYKGAPSGSVETISANTPFYITSYYKGYSSTRALIFDGYDTITVADEYQNVNVYHRITDDIKNHINYNY